MKKTFKKVISALLLVLLVFVITFCCCLEENIHASAEPASITYHQKLEECHHPEENQHQHSEGQDECSCPKHLSFLPAQSVDLAFNSGSQLLAKDFMANLRIENIVLLASLSNHSQGPPWQEHLDRVSIPIYLKISNLRL